VTKGSDAILLRNRQGTYSCEKRPRKPATCFLVARAGRAIPRAFDAGVQKVFNTYLTTFTQPLVAFDISVVSESPAVGSQPAATCFAVVPKTDTPPPPVPGGTYCYAADGILVHATYPSGTLDLKSLADVTPAPKLLVPPARPTPIPGA
jgi:hypothetical protein